MEPFDALLWPECNQHSGAKLGALHVKGEDRQPGNRSKNA